MTIIVWAIGVLSNGLRVFPGRRCWLTFRDPGRVCDCVWLTPAWRACTWRN